MNCTEFLNLLDAFLEEELSKEDAERMLAHAAECEECAALLSLRRDLRSLEDDVDVPEEFSASWRAAVEVEAKQEKRAPLRSFRQSWLAAAAALVMIFGGAVAMSRGRLPTVRRRADAPLVSVTEEAMEKKAEDAGEAMELMAAGALSNVNFENAAPTLEIAAEEADASAWGMAYEAAEEAPDMSWEGEESVSMAAPMGVSMAAKSEARESAPSVLFTAAPTPLPTSLPTSAPTETPAPEPTEAVTEKADETEEETSSFAWWFYLGLAVCVSGIAVLVLWLGRNLKKGRA